VRSVFDGHHRPAVAACSFCIRSVLDQAAMRY
jgi:hypothetical protein